MIERNRIIRKTLKVLGIILLSVTGLLIILILVLRIPAIQQQIVSRAEQFLEGKVGTEVSISHAYLAFPKSLQVAGVYMEDQAGDTLLYFDEVTVDMDLLALLRKTIELNSVDVDQLVSNIRLREDSTFNFTYIIDAFAGDTSTTAKDSTESWQFSLEDVDLNGIRLHYTDVPGSGAISLNLGTLELRMDQVDLEKNVFHVDELTIGKTDLKYLVRALPPSQDQKETASSSEDSPLPDIQVDYIEISGTTLLYSTPEQKYDLAIGTFEVEMNEMNLANYLFDVDHILLEDTKAAISMAQTESTPESDTASSSTVPLEILVGDLVMENNEFSYSAAPIDSTEAGFNPNYFTLQSLTADVGDIKYTPNIIEADINQLAFNDPAGFRLQDVQGEFLMDSKHLAVSGFRLATSASEIHLQGESHYTSREEIMEPATRIDLTISDTHVGTEDLLYFVPELQENEAVDFGSLERLRLDVKLGGTLRSLNVANLSAETGRTRLTLTGTIGNTFNPDSLIFDIFQTLTSSRADLKAILTTEVYPSELVLPETFTLQSSLEGSIDDLNGEASLTSSMGDVEVTGKYTMTKDTIPVYDVTIKTKGLAVGTLMNNPQQFGTLSLEISANGRGISPENFQVQLNGNVTRFDFNQYTYNNLQIDGEVAAGFFDGHVSMSDENLTFTFNGQVNQQSEEHVYHASLNLETADLQALNFSQTPLVLQSQVETDIRTKDFKRFNGEVAIRKFSVYNGIETYRVDSLLYTSIDQEGKTEININSDLMEGKFTGNVNLFQLPDALMNHFQYYYTLQDTLPGDSIPHQEFELLLDLKNTDLITEIVLPELESFDPGELTASFNSSERKLDFNLNINEIKYQGISTNLLQIFASSDRQNLTAGLQILDLKSTNMSIPTLRLTADVEEDFFSTRLSIHDSIDQKKYVIKGQFQSLDSAYLFSLDPDSLMLAYEMWNISENNGLYFGPSGFRTEDFLLSKNTQKISVETLENSRHKISFDDFQLNTIGDALGRQDSILTGQIDGSVTIQPVDTLFGLDADLTFQDISYLKEQIGTLHLKADKPASEEHYNITLNASGPNQFQVNGQYFTSREERTTFDLDIAKIDLGSLAPLAAGGVSKMYGTLSGKLTLKGAFTSPKINGNLHFAEVGIRPTELGTLLKVNDESIRINNSTFHFNDFDLKDKNNNTATLNGELTMVDASFYKFDLDLSANDFLVLDSDSEDNELYYGTLRVDAHADISGTSARPEVDLQVEVQEESNVSYMIPESEYNALEQENIVVFKSPETTDSLAREVDTTSAIEFQGIELNANIGINDQSTFNIVIDPLTGDQLTIQGTANLTIDMNRQGDIQMGGRYEISSGIYTFSFYKLVRREFNITAGSSITWMGEPTDATMDIRASYRVETSVYELLANQIAGTTDDNRYREQLPFLVYLNIDGPLTQPEISFELDMPQEVRNAFNGAAYARIQDINSRESELNKQVFALLILQRFITDDPFSAEPGSTLADNTRRSVSRIMSDQLNRLAGNIDQVDITFDLESYQNYSGGQAENRTDLEVGLSKNLFNDRVSVKVSGNVNLEGGQAQQSASDFIGDLVLEYRITPDGRLRVTAFRRTDFDVISGEIIETGTGLIFVREYDNFKELFQSK